MIGFGVVPDHAARYAAILRDLEDEGAALERTLVGLAHEDWRLSTQSSGWTVAHQVGHLEITEQLMRLAILDERAFRERATTSRVRPEISPADLERPDFAQVALTGWLRSRDALLEAFRSVDAGRRIPWMGPSMSVASAATSRIMEIWAHGQDVLDAIGRTRPATSRLRHIAHLAVAARDYSFLNRGLPAPSVPFRVEIAGPDGELWAWGPEDAPQRVCGEAYDFALLATRRIHRADARVEATGRDAVTWMRTIQAYAGPPGPRRRPVGARARDSPRTAAEAGPIPDPNIYQVD